MKADNLPEKIVAAVLASLRQQSNGIQKRRAKTLPSVSKNSSELEITGKFELTSGGVPFLRADNKSENYRILIQHFQRFCSRTESYRTRTVSYATVRDRTRPY